MLSYYTHAKPHFEKMALDVHGLASDEPELLDIIGSQPCPLCGKKLRVGDAECRACGIPNAAGLSDAQAVRRRDEATDAVALRHKRVG